MSRWFFAGICVLLLFTIPKPAICANYTSSTAEALEVQRLTDTYFQLLDSRKYADAYAMQSPNMQATMPFHEWFAATQDTARVLGPRIERTQTGITWYLDPPNSPGPGLYVAVDFQSRFANSRQHNEYLVWYRKTSSDPFKLIRHETNFLVDDNASAAEEDSVRIVEPPLEEADGHPIGFPTVQAARESLTTRSDVKVRPMQDGWLVVEDPSENAIWSFAPAGHPAYPAAVKRFTYEKDGSVMLGMSALCQAGKADCDNLIRQFQEMNRKVIDQTKQNSK
ncbi:MAG TPA: DUF4019 domain-containing protein [Pseudoxanthomonas sp.]